MSDVIKINVIDGKTIELVAGDCLRVAPAALRRFGAAADSAFEYLCIQVKANSLEAFSAQDAEIPA